jgi:hypothetical protein
MSTTLQRYAMPSGEIGSAGGQTLIAALLPILLAPHAPSAFWIGLVIGSEGLFALVLPYVAGASGDSLSRRFRSILGRRGLLLAVAMPPMALALVLIPFRDSFWSLAGAAVIYFISLHLYATPLRALLIEATPSAAGARCRACSGRCTWPASPSAWWRAGSSSASASGCRSWWAAACWW